MVGLLSRPGGGLMGAGPLAIRAAANQSVPKAPMRAPTPIGAPSPSAQRPSMDIGSGMASIGKAMSNVAGIQKQKAAEAKKAAAQETVTNAASAFQTGVKGWVNPDTGEATPDIPAGPQAAAWTLSQNPDTAPMAMQMFSGEHAYKRGREDKKTDTEAQWAQDQKVMDAGQKFQSDMYGKRRADQLQDASTARGFQLEDAATARGHAVDDREDAQTHQASMYDTRRADQLTDIETARGYQVEDAATARTHDENMVKVDMFNPETNKTIKPIRKNVAAYEAQGFQVGKPGDQPDPFKNPRWVEETITKAAQGEAVDPNMLSMAIADYEKPKIYTDPVTQQQSMIKNTVPAEIMRVIRPSPVDGGGTETASLPAEQPGQAPTVAEDGLSITPLNGNGQSRDDLKNLKAATTGFDRIEQSLNAYEKLVSELGAEIWPGEGQNRLKTAYTDFQMELKELFNLGVLNGPDLSILSKALTDPTTLASYGRALIDSSIFVDQVNHFRDKLDSTRKSTLKQYGGNTGDPKTETAKYSIQPGHVVGDKVFIGGDPHKEENWTLRDGMSDDAARNRVDGGLRID